MNNTTIRLTPEQTNAANQARRILNDIVPDLDAAAQCGIDCQQYHAERQRIMNGLDKIVQHFGARTE